MDRVGTFKVTSGAIMVSDPCYESGEYELPALNGDWRAEIEISDEGSWGKRVALLRAYSMTYPSAAPYEVVGNAGVDSGQMSVSDLARFHELPSDRYDDACEATLSDERSGIVDGFAAVSSTGFGDGNYEVRVDRIDGKVVAVEIDFIP